MAGTMSSILPKSARIFHERAAEYDDWFDDSLLFDIELRALHELTTNLPEPRLEVGVGPGRFARELGVAIGVDPAMGALVIARNRIPLVCQAMGEALPVQSSSVPTVFLLFTLCFTENPVQVMMELGRIIQPAGHVVLGVVPRESPWGKLLRKKKQDGHPFYQHSRFYDIQQITTWFAEAGLTIVEERSSLVQLPGEVVAMEQSRPGRDENAGFVLLVGRKK